MDLNNYFFWLVLVTTLGFLIQLLRLRKHLSSLFGGIAVPVTILAMLGIAYFTVPEICGSMTVIPWFFFFILPNFLFRRMRTFLIAGKPGRALAIGYIVRFLHPFDNMREQVDLIRAMKIAHEGRIDEALAVFGKYQDARTTLGRLAILNSFRYRSDWNGLHDWLLSQASFNSTLKSFQLRACGELGDLDGVIRAFRELEPELVQLNATQDLMGARMMLFAFCGRTDLTRQLLDNQLAHLPVSFKQFWISTAEIVSGDASAQYEFEELAKSSDLLVRLDADHRLKHPLPQATPLTPENEKALREIESRHRGEGIESRSFPQLRRRAYATFILLALNLGVFVVENIIGDSESGDTLYDMGALRSSSVWEGQWWRLPASLFLHAGWLHLATNMVGLYYFGPFLEFALGRFRFFLVYFLSGLGAAFGTLILMSYFGEQIVVGASGCLMGVLGATLAVHRYYSKHLRVGLAGRKVRFLLMIFAAQFIFDVLTPQVSFSSHLFGAVIGFCVGLICKPRAVTS